MYKVLNCRRVGGNPSPIVVIVHLWYCILGVGDNPPSLKQYNTKIQENLYATSLGSLQRWGPNSVAGGEGLPLPQEPLQPLDFDALLTGDLPRVTCQFPQCTPRPDCTCMDVAATLGHLSHLRKPFMISIKLDLI